MNTDLTTRQTQVLAFMRKFLEMNDQMPTNRAIGDASIPANRTDLAAVWTRDMQREEGWPPGDDTPHGALGIRVLSAECELPGFDGCELHEGRAA